MKNNLILLLLSVCFSSILQAQELSQSYLYDEFKDGLVLFKDGRRSSAMLNYNTTVEEMLYKNGEQIWAIANPLEIAAIDIQGDMFVYVNKHIFYQVVKVGVGEVYVEWKTTYFSQEGCRLRWVFCNGSHHQLFYLPGRGGSHQINTQREILIQAG